MRQKYLKHLKIQLKQTIKIKHFQLVKMNIKNYNNK